MLGSRSLDHNGKTRLGGPNEVIQTTRGNLLAADADVLVNAVNTIGVMGKGIALQFKRAWPEYFRAYQSACDAGVVELGQVWVYPLGRLIRPRYIVSFPTKGHWRETAKLESIDAGLESLVQELLRLDVDSVALPALGCGLGGLEWKLVLPKIEQAFSQNSKINVLLYEPGGLP